MSAPITRYRPSRPFLWAGLTALAIAAFSGWVALRWPYVWIAAGLAAASAILFILMFLAPVIEIHESHLKIGGRSIGWAQVRRLDRISLVPLLVRMTLADDKLVPVFYAGDADSANRLLRHLRRYSREAVIDGVPYKRFWGESLTTAPEGKHPVLPPCPLLLPEDEAEIERMFQRLKAVGHLDQTGSAPKGTPRTSGPERSGDDH